MAKEKKEKKKIPTAKKRILQSEKREKHNRSFKSRLKRAIRSLLSAISGKDEKSSLLEKLKIVYSFADKAVKKRIIKKNKAARIKSRMSEKLPKEKPPKEES